MFCPKCATQNAENARFCRACGTDISLVPQVLSGHLAQQLSHVEDESLDDDDEGRKRRRGRKKGAGKGIESAISSIFLGLAFLIVFLTGLLFFRPGFMIWVWFIIPSLACLGEGVGRYIRIMHEEKRRGLAAPHLSPTPVSFPQTGRGAELPPRADSEFYTPPASVTEGTTRHLGVREERAPKDV
ncbi:MAG TPA: zinc ribbon domain-containing protein [Pyrinomonadaceae bacterium]|nr:zinc ribbon domain-containing protein [Pyrinomonadaceae bacterium]